MSFKGLETEDVKLASVATVSTLGAAFLVLNQIGSRALTFVVNQLLFRFLSPGIYGVASQLELFSVSILYFSRESIRVALQRQRGDDNAETSSKQNDDKERASGRMAITSGPSRRMQEAANLSHVAVGLGLLLTLVFSWLYLQKADTAVLRTPYLHQSLDLYALATILELLNEPAYAIASQQMLYGSRASAEFLGSFTRCITTCSMAILASRTGKDLGVLPFAVGQLSYALILNIVYLSKIIPISSQHLVSLLPRTITHNPNNQAYILSRFSRPLITIAATFYGQSIFKQFQTSGDGYLIATLATLPSQGAYALATNYGGLLARVLFQPIEESSRSLFGRLLPSQPSPHPSNKKKDSADEKSLSQAKSHLSTFLRLYALLSLLAISLGPPLSPLLLKTVAGSRWSDTEAPEVLASYCYLIGLLAINGILEAFVTAVATPAQVAKQNAWMAGFSIAFAATGWLVLRVLDMGARGLVVTNAVVMGLRIVWSWRFVQRYFRSEGMEKEEGAGLKVRGLLPSGGSLAVGVGTRACLGQVLQGPNAEGLVVLVQCGFIVGGCGLGVLLFERGFLISVLPNAVVERVPFLKRYTSTGNSDKDMKFE